MCLKAVSVQLYCTQAYVNTTKLQISQYTVTKQRYTEFTPYH